MERFKSVKVRNVILGDGCPKICVPIVAGKIEGVLEQAGNIAQLPADLAEWRIDWLESSESGADILPELKRILGDKPLLITFRTAKEGGKKSISQDAYVELYKRYLKTGFVDLLDVEYFMDDAVQELVGIAHENGCKVIISSHEFEHTPLEGEMIDRLLKMQESGADITKLAVMPRSEEDVERLLRVSKDMRWEKADRPFITMSMGGLGAVSRICGVVTGSAVTFGSAAKASAPGQIEVKELAGILKSKKKHIFLIGFMGTGKSTVARTLSKYARIPQIEMDEAIVKKELRPITEIFEKEGEDYFRRLETLVLKGLLNEEPQIVSCGGGVPMRRENVDLMRACGTIVLLQASPETIFNRVKNSTARPILNDRMNLEYIKELMENRREAYETAADICINTEGKEVGDIAREILSELQMGALRFVTDN